MNLYITQKLGAYTWTALSESEEKYIIRQVEPERLDFYRYLQQIQAQIPFMPKIMGSGEDETRGLYVIEEYVTGEPLNNFVQEFKGNEQRILMFLTTMTSQIQTLHELEVLHGDIKPENTLLSVSKRKLYLIDFEFAQIVDLEGKAASLGYTPLYCSIEQLESGLLLPETDIRSLGILTLELFLGHHPIFVDVNTDSQEDIARIIAESEIQSDTNDALLTLLEKMVRVKPSDRVSFPEILDTVEQLGARYRQELTTIEVNGIEDCVYCVK